MSPCFNLKKLLFQNIGLLQTIIKNTFWLGAAEFITRLLKFVLIVFVARVLGASEYGKFTFALSFVTLFAVFSDLGVGGIMVREFSKDRGQEKEFPSLLSLKLILSFSTFLLILLGAFFITNNPVVRQITVILGGMTAINGLIGLFYGFFVARQRMDYQATVQILQAIFLTGIGFLVLFFAPSIKNLSWSYLLAAGLGLTFALLLFCSRISPLKINFNFNVWSKYLRLSWPLALTGFLGGFYGNIDSVMMGHLKQIAQVGWYNAAFKIIAVVLLPPVLISQSFFPVLNSAFSRSKQGFQKIFNSFFEIMIILGMPIALGGIILAPRIIQAIYGAVYLPAVMSFQILLVMAFISYLSLPFNQYLIIANRQKWLFWISLFGAVIDIILNIILIPRYSLNGAAFATALSMLLATIALFILSQRHLKLQSSRNARIFLMAVLSSALMGTFLSLVLKFYTLGVIWLILSGGGLYFANILFFYKIKFLKKI
jgi:O-antigen/teichoic acid export membrane protein